MSFNLDFLEKNDLKTKDQEMIMRAWEEISQQGLKVEDVLHTLFFNCQGYSPSRLEKILKEQ